MNILTDTTKRHTRISRFSIRTAPFVLVVALVPLVSRCSGGGTIGTDGGGSRQVIARLEPVPREAREQESFAIAADAVMAEPKSAPLGAQKIAARPSSLATPAAVSGERYARLEENGFQVPQRSPLSTFSIDVDTASYANARRFISDGSLPPIDAVRIEEFVNYFHYDYPAPDGHAPLKVVTGVAEAPWAPTHRLVRVALQARNVPPANLPASNLVFLLDTSGSMDAPDKLPLVLQSMNLLVDQLRPQDRVAIVTYAGSAGLVLPSTPGSDKETIRKALSKLAAEGSTAGAEGIQLAYDVAEKNLIQGANNRVILATDGDFNVGVSTDSELIRLIEDKRDRGVYLSILGVGTGNYQDAKMEQLADKGNGNFSYLDSIREADKVLVREMSGTLYTVAKDVKVQVEFNPAKVGAYRLVGYENRKLADEDFNNDRKDAGEMGAGHQVTALYEVIPVGSDEHTGSVDPLRYQKPRTVSRPSEELLTVKVRYKLPERKDSDLISETLVDQGKKLAECAADFRFAAAVAEFGLILRDSSFKGSANIDQVIQEAKEAKGADENGDRAEFIRLAESARLLSGQRKNE